MTFLKTAGVVLIGMIIAGILKNPVVTNALAPLFSVTAGFMPSIPPNYTNFLTLGLIYVLIAGVLAYIIGVIQNES